MQTSRTHTGAATRLSEKPPVDSLEALLRVPPSQLGDIDIAVVNLLCAEGLPGAEDLNVPNCLATLDRWAKAVGRFVRDCWSNYQRDPDRYDRQRGTFCFLAMATILKHPRHIGVMYQSTAVGNYDFYDSRDDLLHGLLTRRLGTCTSLPVLFVALGRRLGWPMHVAVAKFHVICQWVNADGSRLNLEGSCPGGGNVFPDSYFYTWPHSMTPYDRASGRFLRPLTPPEQLALFLETRGHCLTDNKRFDEAKEAYRHAKRLAPNWSEADRHLELLAARRLFWEIKPSTPDPMWAHSIGVLPNRRAWFPPGTGIPGMALGRTGAGLTQR